MFDNSKVGAKEKITFSVSEISAKIKDLLENNLNNVSIKGEISGLKVAASGHGYFNLKDNLSILACTCWKPVLSKINFNLMDGIEVTIFGKITSYSGQSRYQLTVDKIEPAGVGAMMQILQETRNRLEKEGLFDASNKQPIPLLPNIIGVITSITGAVIKDIIHRITDRHPTNIIIWPVTVQGESAASEIILAIEGFNQLVHKKPAVIIIARGGGSIEDLWPFNEEKLIRAVYASQIPIISAVGHETDYTLIDFVADIRAPTPTAAAEFAVPVGASLKYTLGLYYNKLLNGFNFLMSYNKQTIDNYNKTLKYKITYLDNTQQKLDDITFRLQELGPSIIKEKLALLLQFSLEKFSPVKVIDYKFLELSGQFNSLENSMNKYLKILNHKINVDSVTLETLDYKNILKRGFNLAIDSQQNIIKSKNVAAMHDKFSIQFFDGNLEVEKLSK